MAQPPPPPSAAGEGPGGAAPASPDDDDGRSFIPPTTLTRAHTRSHTHTHTRRSNGSRRTGHKTLFYYFSLFFNSDTKMCAAFVPTVASCNGSCVCLFMIGRWGGVASINFSLMGCWMPGHHPMTSAPAALVIRCFVRSERSSSDTQFASPFHLPVGNKMAN